MAVPKGYRSFHEGPYHYCGRCSERRHLSELEWQRGILVCRTGNCIDTGVFPLIGQREDEINKAFELPSDELQPDPKIAGPEVGNMSDDDISF